MGQKINPVGFRVGINKPWLSRWYSEQDYAHLLHEDLKMKELIKRRLFHAGVSRIEIHRALGKCTVDIYSARPGIVIGKRGAGIDTLKLELERMVSLHGVKETAKKKGGEPKKGVELFVNIKEIRKAELDGQLVAENIAMQLERRVAYRRVCKRAVQSAMKLGAKGIKVKVGGRLGGAEIARSDWYMDGSVPLHTLRAIIDYGFTEARTTYGIIGVKTWICRGESAEKQSEAEEPAGDAPAVG